MIKAVIFDLDGTLTEFNLDVKACRTEVIQNLSEQGIPKKLFSLNESAFDMLLKVSKHLGSTANKQKIEKLRKIIFTIVEKHELQAAKKTKMFPEIPETLRTLKDMNQKIALCTISSEVASGHILNQFDIKQFFDFVFPRESVTEVKPHPEHLQVVLDALKLSPQETVLVGDSTKDVLCASHLKILAVGVTTGLSSKSQLIDSGANYVISSVSEVPKLISKLNKQV
jgi:phosphoglycolate phosphatase